MPPLFLRLLLVVVLMFLIDWYVYQAVKVSFSESNEKIRMYARWLHWFIFTLSLLIVGLGISKLLQFVPKYMVVYIYATIAVFYLAKILVVLFLFVDDLIRLLRIAYYAIAHLFSTNQQVAASGGRNISRLRFLNQAALVIGFIPFSALIYGMVRGAYRYTVRQVKVQIPGLPQEFKGFKIVQISDIHSGSFSSQAPLQKAVELINQQKPDLLLFTGDLVNNIATEIEPHINTMRKLKAPFGKFSVLGNHDYGDYIEWESKEAKKNNLAQLIKNHQRCDLQLMLNENVAIEKNGAKINLIGIENWGAYGRFAKYGKLDLALEGLKKDEVNILMSHDPSHWTEVVSKKYPQIALTLSGHTHGFQFGIEIPGFKWSPVKYMYPHWAGLYTNEQGQHLYVNRGLGFLGYPGRVGIWPEITVIELA